MEYNQDEKIELNYKSLIYNLSKKVLYPQYPVPCTL